MLSKKGKLTANPVNFTFYGGQVMVNVAVIDRKQPEWLLSVQANRIQLGEIFRQDYAVPPLTGELNFFVDFKSLGASVHEIAANLNGEFGITLEDGGVRRSTLELVFLNPLGWLFSYGISEDKIHITCGLADYEIKQGIIRSKVFFVDGPKLLIRGNTKINTKRNKYRFYPHNGCYSLRSRFAY